MRWGIWYYIGLMLASALFLFIHYQTHNEFLLHVAAIPLEVLVAVFIVERFLENRENREKRKQLRFIKGYLFRSDMRNLFLANFDALKTPQIDMEMIRAASLDEIKAMREQADNPEYRSFEVMEPVIHEYVNARDVWKDFLDRAISYNFEEIVEDMVYILHFIQDVKFYKEFNPEKLFISEAARNPQAMAKVNRVLGDGVRKFLEYAIELKEVQPELFEQVLDNYVFSSKMRAGHRDRSAD